MSRTHTVAQNPAHLFVMPTLNPAMTWGLGNRAAYVPGPGGPIPDPRLSVTTLAPGPIFGRVGALSCLRTFGPTVGVFLGWPPVAPWNNAWAVLGGTGYQQYVPGWTKPAPTSNSGF